MKKNIYTDGISRIKAPDELLNKCIENIRESEVTEEVISFEKARSKRRWLKPIGAVAAALAVVIALGSVGSFKEYESTKNPFVLTVNAEEISDEAYVDIANLDRVGAQGAWRQPPEGGDCELMSIGGNFNFNVQCVGENIESVTYSSDNSCLHVIYDYDGLIDYVPLTMQQMIDGYGVGSWRSWYKEVNSCTLAYDRQPYCGPEPIKPDEYEEKHPLCVSFEIDDPVEAYASNSDEFTKNENDLFIESFNNSSTKFSVDITANYTDGSTLTKTLFFKCEKTEDGEGVCLSAIVASDN